MIPPINPLVGGGFSREFKSLNRILISSRLIELLLIWGWMGGWHAQAHACAITHIHVKHDNKCNRAIIAEASVFSLGSNQEQRTGMYIIFYQISRIMQLSSPGDHFNG